MRTDGSDLTPYAPQVWNVVFNREAASGWARWVPGRYKHVRAYAFVPASQVWLFYDVSFVGTDISAVPHGQHWDKLWEFIGPDTASDIVSVTMLPPRRRRFPWSNWCTSALRHLLNLPGGALRPDAFYRECVENGGIPFEAPNAGTTIQRPATGPGCHRAECAGGSS